MVTADTGCFYQIHRSVQFFCNFEQKVYFNCFLGTLVTAHRTVQVVAECEDSSRGNA